MTVPEFPAPPTEAPSTKLRPRDLLPALVGAAIGFLVSFAGFRYGPAWMERWFGDAVFDVWVWLALPLGYFVSVLVHELGHLGVGVATGLRPLALYAGPLQIDFSTQGARFRINRSTSLGGGLASCIPRGVFRAGAFAAMVAAGPAASLILAAACVALALGSEGRLAGFALLTGGVSAVLGLLSLIPMRAGFASDGAQLVDLALRRPIARERVLLIELLAASHEGTRPRALDRASIDALAASADPTTAAVGGAYQLAALADAQAPLAQTAPIARRLAEAVREAPAAELALPVRRGLALQIAAWLGIEARDANAARAWLGYTGRAFEGHESRAIAEAAVAYAAGDVEATRRGIEATRAAMARSQDRGAVMAYTDQLARLERALSQSAADAVPSAPGPLTGV